MKQTDDTIRTGKQAHEDVLVAMSEAGAIPGIKPGPLTSLRPGDIAVVRVPKHTALGGGVAGARFAIYLLQDTPPDALGRTLVAFDGWADDPRELCEIPMVVEFCQGLLFGAEETPNLDWARNVLSLLLDERVLGLLGPDGEVADQSVLQAPGALWLVAHAHASRVFTLGKGGCIMRDLGLNLALLDGFTGSGTL